MASRRDRWPGLVVLTPSFPHCRAIFFLIRDRTKVPPSPSVFEAGFSSSNGYERTIAPELSR